MFYLYSWGNYKDRTKPPYLTMGCEVVERHLEMAQPTKKDRTRMKRSQSNYNFS